MLARARAALAKWGSTRDRAEALGSDLSPAQRQIVEIMRALVSNPRIICFDEPTSSLGDEEVDILFALIRRSSAEGVAIVYVSHRMDEIFELADRITVLRDGGLRGHELAAETSHDELVRLMVGRDLSQFFHRDPAPVGDTVLELRGVSNPMSTTSTSPCAPARSSASPGSSARAAAS